MPESGAEVQKILVKGGAKRKLPAPAQPDSAWGWLGWFGLVLAVAGLVDLALLWWPVGLGSPEWEFATVVSTTSAMPLVAIGLCALLASAAARGSRWLLMVMGAVLVLGAVILAVMLVLFLTNVPMALQATADQARVGIVKASVKTVVLAVLFGGVYAVGAIWALRQATGKAREA